MSNSYHERLLKELDEANLAQSQHPNEVNSAQNAEFYGQEDGDDYYSDPEGGGEYSDHSFDDSDLHNKDPGKLIALQVLIHSCLEDIQNQLKELNEAAVNALKEEEVDSANDKLKR